MITSLILEIFSLDCVLLSLGENLCWLLLAGIHIHFFSESWAGQVSLMAYLPIYNLCWAGKSAELYKLKRMVKKLCATGTFLISIYVLQVAMVGQFAVKARWRAGVFPHIRQLLPRDLFAKRLLKMSHLKVCKAPASCSPFFPTKVDETRFKKCQILTIAVMFSMNGLWMQCFSKNWAWDHFVENATPLKMASKLMISLQTEAACYSPLF